MLHLFKNTKYENNLINIKFDEFKETYRKSNDLIVMEFYTSEKSVIEFGSSTERNEEYKRFCSVLQNHKSLRIS